MFYYAQLNTESVCVGISQLGEEIIQANMVRIDEYSSDYLYRKYENSKWSVEKYYPETIEVPSEIDMIGMVTTQNSIELSELKQQVEAIGQGVVEIMLNQQMGGM